MKSDRTLHTDIPAKVKAAVWERDNQCCILCGKRGNPEAHYIPRSQGGLGIEENIVTLCRDCHFRYDATTERGTLKVFIKDYLNMHYPNFTDEQRIYKKER